MMKKAALILATALSFAATAPAAHAALVLGSRPCAGTDVSPTASACQGWFVDNLNSGNAIDLNDSAAALNALLGTSFTGATLPILETIEIGSGNIIDFATSLTGLTLFSVHVGEANGNDGIGYNGTGFFLIDAGSGLDTIALNVGGLSNARLFSTGVAAVPEPGTWAMLLLGFGAVGYAMRRRRQPAGATQTRVRFAF